MNHKYSQQEWIDYLEGDLAPRQREEMDQHLQACDKCSRFYQNMLEVEGKLRFAAQRQRESLRISEARARQAADACILQMPKTGTQVSPAVRRKLTTLENFMSPICGSETTARAMHVAAHRTSVASPEVIGEVLWEDFLENLSSVAGMLCGEPAANLILQVGSLAQ